MHFMAGFFVILAFINFLEKGPTQTCLMPNGVKVRLQCIIMTISCNSFPS